MAEVDVLLPIRSPAPWLGQALASLSGQTLTDHRVVAVIHGSDSDIERTLDSYPQQLCVVSALKADSLGEVLNIGLAHCTAEFIARMDADDECAPARFARQRDYLLMHPEVALVGSSASLIDTAGHLVGIRLVDSDPDRLASRMRWRNALVHPAVMFRRVVVTSIGGYSAEARGVEDYELWLRMATTSVIGGIDEPLLRYRRHAGQVSKAQALSPEARMRIGRARLDLARVRRESLLAAHIRQHCWSWFHVARSYARIPRAMTSGEAHVPPRSDRE